MKEKETRKAKGRWKHWKIKGREQIWLEGY